MLSDVMTSKLERLKQAGLIGCLNDTGINSTNYKDRGMTWISVSDRLPEKDKNVILFDGNEIFCGTYNGKFKENHSWGNQCCDGICYGWYEKNEVTHWMPLPQPPSNDE